VLEVSAKEGPVFEMTIKEGPPVFEVAVK